MMKFISYNQFKNIKFIAKCEFSKVYKVTVTWIDDLTKNIIIHK